LLSLSLCAKQRTDKKVSGLAASFDCRLHDRISAAAAAVVVAAAKMMVVTEMIKQT